MMLISIGMPLFVVDHHRFIFNTRLITWESLWADKQTIKQSLGTVEYVFVLLHLSHGMHSCVFLEVIAN